ncbi:MAG: chemotaxis protein CheB [Ferruginibacter sp.]
MKKKPAETEVKDGLIQSKNLFPVVGIGASAGGLVAFRKLVHAIPADSGMAYVLVQHLDPKHESLLPELLQKVSVIPVLEISDDIKVKPDHIYVIPGNKMLVATDGVLKLSPRISDHSFTLNLPIDLFFRSLAEIHREHAIGVVLSGTASDGTAGLKAIRESGGLTFAQDEASAEFDGMPGSAIRAGVVDFVLPPESIPGKLLEVKDRVIYSDEDLENKTLPDEESFKQILTLVRMRKGTDFTFYKQSTIRRRILRRMVINKNEQVKDYLLYLREHKPEQDALFQDLLIPVTSFFRDEQVFESLCGQVLPAILKNKGEEDPLRIWIAGCSTGEEAYSIAICLKECLGARDVHIQIFATDISEPAILKARRGIYSKAETENVSPQRLQNYFTKIDGHYRIKKEIKDTCVFAIHNFLNDPPFGRIDLITCRNVLIYMESYLQKKALTTFHYALNPKGFLLLGKSETGSSVPELFEPSAKHQKIFTRKDLAGKHILFMSRQNEIYRVKQDSDDAEHLETDFQRSADDVLLSRYTPVGVVVNETMDIVHFRGNTAPFLEQASGKPSHNLFKMAKGGLAFELRNILHKAKKEQTSVKRENIPLTSEGVTGVITIEAMPLPHMADPHFLVIFHHEQRPSSEEKKRVKKNVSARVEDDKELRIAQLNNELSQTREDMRNITEDQEAANEELQSANEELLSSSEELQSLNEELETSKEELQSINEELMVVNREVRELNESVSDARDYAEAILATVRDPLLVLDKKHYVKSATPAFYETFNVSEKETLGRSIYEIGNMQWNTIRCWNISWTNQLQF